MNISQWIKSVEQAVPLNESPLSTDQPHTLLKRGRGSRTSSLLEPFTNQEKRGKKGKQPAIYIDSSSSDTSDATSGSTSSRSTSQPSSSSSNRYRRRPRHHTKADKYNSSSRSKPQQKRREKKKKIERQKRTKHSRRNKHKSKEATGVVQTFKAKNVPKDRLTVSSTLCLLFMTIAETETRSLTLALNSGYTPKDVHRALPRAKAVSCEKTLLLFEC